VELEHQVGTVAEHQQVHARDEDPAARLAFRAQMRFGIFYEHQLPRPWEDGAHERLLGDALDQVELADKVGFDYVWEVEHHFLEEYSHSSAPEVFLAAASQRTKRIRLGHGIVQLPPAFNHPARIVERAATLDLISGGRVELGTGEASSQAELGGFGVTRATKREQWEEALDAVARMFVEEPFAGIDGRHVTMPPRNVMPKAKQKPHPPLWVACSRRDTILLAARKGLGALSFSFVEPEAAKEWVEEYYALIESDECVPAGFAVNPNFAVVLPMMCHPDEAEAIARGIDGAHFFGYSLAHYYVFGEHRPGTTDIWEEFQANREQRGFARSIVTPDQAPLGVKLLQEGLGSLRGAVGTPDQVADLCARYEAAGVDQVIFVMQAGKNRHEHICESIELFGKEVLPRFAAEADAHEQAKRERLAAACERALARREPARVLEPGSYVIQPQDEPRPAYTANGDADGSFADRARAAVGSAFATLVRGRSDDQLDRLMGTGPGLRVIFKGMENAFVPEKARGFSGEILYELRGSRGTRPWTVSIDGERALAEEREANEPAVTLRADVPVFVRIAAGELDPAKAMLEGTLEIEGDFALVGRLGEMFGADPR
jgi:alkanesulfonate monooxygenase SsuD/methylene tetrahydromethanopterin reductase-like flavin-dependent oxidoreductase (luciferase family)/putative sterol carrier protein